MTLKRAAPFLLLLLIPAFALAQATATGAIPALPSITIGPGPSLGPAGAKAGAPTEVAKSLQIVALLTVLAIAPALLVLTTAFTRIVIIFSFVRSALGTPTIPPNQVVVGLSLFLTLYVMAPTYKKINATALQPYMAGKLSQERALEAASGPARDFMIKNTYEKDLKLFIDLRKEKPMDKMAKADVAFTTLVPAFVISELKTAFIVGFYIFIPFLVIDLVVASGLMSMGMMMLPPTVVSLPAKLLVFVLADGWGTLVAAILQGYR